ncbi:Peptidase [Phytophthora megakarya]|uniref:Peptidase n=1 Tax=Phytophthora megakarya TaxID=4795 RepID=A0A225UY86_9STRA|nr:Peptidase [Phytophthora megakarya]
MATVTLHVYDLSHGMARQLSPSLLGKTIDGVWHTGVLVFGKEYFFGGGGIQAMAPELVVQRYGMQPMRTVTLGTTSLSQQQFEQFLRENNARFTDATYDLLRHNCNNFSDEVAKFLVGSGIPQYILDLPNEALNSPFGAMLRPMLENMNNQMHAAPGDQLFAIPFNDPSRANLAVPAATAASNSSVDLASRRFKISGTPALHLDKMVQRIKSLNAEKLLTDAEISSLDELSAHVAADNKEVAATQNVDWWKIVSKLLSQGHGSAFFFPSLGLTRVLLLQSGNASDATAEKKTCFEAVVHVTEVEPSPLTAAQKTLVLAVLLNAFANPGFSDMALSGSTRFLPFVFSTIADPSTSQEARVLSAHIISNCCLAMNIGEEVVVTTIVCGAVETLDRISRLNPTARSSTDQQTIEGIIVGLGRLLHNFEAARSLSVELGLAEVINRLHVTPGLNDIHPLLSEVVALI